MHELLPFVVIGLATGSVYGLAAGGLVLSYRTSGVFNLAYGAIAAIAAGVFYELKVDHGVSTAVALPVSVLGVGVVLGLLCERIGQVLTGVSISMQVVGTVGLLVSLNALFTLRFGSTLQSYPAFLPTETFRVGGVNVGYDQLTLFLVGLVGVGGLAFVVRATSLGRQMRAVVDDESLLRLSGVAASSVRRWAWLISCVMSSLSGVLIAPLLGLSATALTLIVVQSFGAAAVGRFSNLWLTYGGALAIGILAAVSTKYSVNHHWMQGVPSSLPFVVLLVVLLATPKGRLPDLGSTLRQRVVVPPGGALWLRGVKLLIPAAVLVAVPSFAGAHLSEWTQGGVYTVLLLSLSLLVRTSNQISLCHVSFAAVGAAAFHKWLAAGLPWIPAVLLAGLTVVPIGAIIAIPAIRLSGIYLALATLGFGIFLEQEFFQTNLMFGLGSSTVAVPRPGFASSDRAYYYLVLIFLALTFVIIRSLERARLGRLLRAAGDARVAAQSLGVNTKIPAFLSFCTSAFLAGLAGALLGPIFGVVGPGNFQTIPDSITLVALLMLASRAPGTGSLGAALVGGLAFTLVPGYISSSTVNQWLNVYFGVAAIEAAFASTGRSIPVRRWLAALRGGRETPPTDHGDEFADLAPAETALPSVRSAS